LVVITIIGILVALLLPAVQAAREAARLTQCANHLKQISLAALEHEQVIHWLPSGGWGLNFVGDPTAGSGPLQPGGFFYNILPYMELGTLHDFALKASPATATNPALNQSNTLYQQLSMQMTENVVPMYTCPTRRMPVAHPVESANYGQMSGTYGSYVPKVWFQGDYSANAGSVLIGWGGPSSWTGWQNSQNWLTSQQIREINGVCYQRSQVKMCDITAGTSRTYLVGEKYLDPDYYYAGCDWGDDQSFATGDCDDPNRWTGDDTVVATGSSTTVTPVANSPQMDMPGWLGYRATMFGSAHLSGFQMAFCDGSVRKTNFSINPLIHRRLGIRNDPEPIDAKSY
jgi:prepilin-type processing-associated H-X9-DG protein